MTAPKCTSWISCLPAPVDALCCGPTTTKIEPGAPVLLVVRLHALQERLPGCAGGVAAGAAAGREAQDAHARLPRPQHQADEARPEGRGGGWPRWVLRKPSTSSGAISRRTARTGRYSAKSRARSGGREASGARWQRARSTKNTRLVLPPHSLNKRPCFFRSSQEFGLGALTPALWDNIELNTLQGGCWKCAHLLIRNQRLLLILM